MNIALRAISKKQAAELYYWVVWKVRADFKGKLKRRRFKF